MAPFLIAALLLLIWVVLFRPSWIVRGILAPLLPEVLFCGPGADRTLALTIDDGPHGRRSLDLLDLLRDLGAPATFFLIGDHVVRHGDGFVTRALMEGHAIGNHMGHDSISARLPRQRFEADLVRTADLIRRAAGPAPVALRWFRPGGGWLHPMMLRVVTQAGYRLVLGSIFPWDTFHPPGRFLRRFLAANAHPGGIIVLHDRPDTIEATIATIRVMVPILRSRGFRFTTLEALSQREGNPRA